tara:strand:- start:252 stop:419 length:168 start_codon:yes stop_codon:yes gene_type:complete
MAHGCIDARDRNEANLLMKELRRLDVAVELTKGDEQARLKRERARVIARLDELSA